MNLLVASDKFKGSLTAIEACDAIARGFRNALSESDSIRTVPVADGGDGLAQTLTDAKDGAWINCRVQNALGNETEARYGLLESGTVAVIEMAEASGLAQLGMDEKDPWRASTFGTGQLILDAVDRGVEKIILGIGGSATNDGGTGMARALGFQFLDHEGREVSDLPSDLARVERIVPPSQWKLPPILVACDVENPLLGESGCTRVYGPQKGIESDSIEKHEARLRHLISLLGEKAEEAAEAKGAGAAGGLGFGGVVFLEAELIHGFDLVSDLLELERHIEWADLVVTGEGKLDRQTDEGKAPAGVARIARSMGKPVYAFCGIREEGAGVQFEETVEISDPERSIEENMAEGADLLEEAAKGFADRAFR